MIKPSGTYDVAIIGTVGLPASYGGFETLAEQLVEHWSDKQRILVFCSGKRHNHAKDRPVEYGGADLEYVNFSANGWQSIPYDVISLWRGARRSRSLLVLGISGGLMLPVIRFCWPKVRIVTNVDGIEWKRQKWGTIARLYLRFAEWAAVHFSHEVVADNQGICDHINRQYGRPSHLVAYGGDNAMSSIVDPDSSLIDTRFEPSSYFFSVCRIEPENNLTSILEAFAKSSTEKLVVVGNWNNSLYARDLRKKFSGLSNIELTDPIYDQSRLWRLRKNAKAYVHGHSAGGTNPSLVEAMYVGTPVLAFDVCYNRHTTENQAYYWQNADALLCLITDITRDSLRRNGKKMSAVARKNYMWASIAKRYQSIVSS